MGSRNAYADVSERMFLRGEETGVDAARLLRVQQVLSENVTGFDPPAEMFPRALEALCSGLGFAAGAFWEPEAEGAVVRCTSAWTVEGDAAVAVFGATVREQIFGRGKRLPGLAWSSGEPVWIEDTRSDERMPPSRRAADAGLLSSVAFPLRLGDDVVGVIELFCTAPRERDEELIDFLRVAGGQFAQYLDRRSTHERLLRQERALNATVNGVVISDATKPGFPIVYVNPGFEALTGYTSDEVLGASCRILQGPESDPEAVEELRTALEEQRETRTTILNYRRDGSTFWNEIYLSPVHEDGRLTQYVGVQNDVSDAREAEDRVAYLAYHDALTGLANRSLLGRHVERALERARQHEFQAALLFLDLDDFKQVNDKLGHAAGDELLRQVAARLEGVTRASDLLARQGGDEFLVLMADITGDGREIAERVAAEIQGALRAPLTVEGRELEMRCSIGISLFPSDAIDGETLLRHADSAMYRAKRSGGRATRVYSAGAGVLGPAPKEAPLPDGAENVLDRILANDEVRAVYQPIVELDGGAVIGWESLARGPEGSPLERPDLLFGAAAATERTAELDWACRAAAARGALDAGLDRSRTLFVNVEPQTLGVAVPEHLADLWQRADELDVVVEITERSLTARPAELLAAVEQIRGRGWRVALDDVGADTRSLALMPLLRPDVIKLDLRLVQDQPSTEIAAIVNAVNAESERTGALVLAEGIETERQLEVARAMGARLGQGWLFGRPGALDTGAPAGTTALPRGGNEQPLGTTPYEVVSAVCDTRRADKRLLLAISHHLENQALTLGAGAVVLSAFQEAERFTKATHRRYTRLAADAAFVAALGGNMSAEPAPGVRGASLEGNDGLLGEWSIAVLGPHFAGALVAMDLGDQGPDMERRFDFCLTYDRELVTEAAAALMRRVTPLG